MKTLLLRMALLVLATNCCFAQNFQGVAYYSSQTQLKDLNITGNDITPDVKEQMMEKMKKLLKKHMN